jgi:hypothetical protein
MMSNAPDMQPLPDYADSPGNHAAPAPSGEFAPIVRRHTDDLRCELAEAIEVSKAAHDRAATHRHAKTISDALRAASEPPCGI